MLYENVVPLTIRAYQRVGMANEASTPPADQTPLEIRIIWDYEKDMPQPTRYRDYVEQDQPGYRTLIKTDPQTITIDPESTLEQVRDDIRRLFHLDEIEAQIYSLNLYLQGAKSDVYSFRTGNWKSIKKALWGGEWDQEHEHSRIVMTARKAKVGEKLWEDYPRLDDLKKL